MILKKRNLWQLFEKFSFTRFLLSGALNTFITWLMYLALVNFVSYKISYSLAYVFGVILAFILNRFFVFKKHRGVFSFFMFPFIYIFQYLFGLLIVWGWIDILHMNVIYAPIISVIITLPTTFILTRFVFVER